MVMRPGRGRVDRPTGEGDPGLGPLRAAVERRPRRGRLSHDPIGTLGHAASRFIHSTPGPHQRAGLVTAIEELAHPAPVEVGNPEADMGRVGERDASDDTGPHSVDQQRCTPHGQPDASRVGPLPYGAGRCQGEKQEQTGRGQPKGTPHRPQHATTGRSVDSAVPIATVRTGDGAGWP